MKVGAELLPTISLRSWFSNTTTTTCRKLGTGATAATAAVSAATIIDADDRSSEKAASNDRIPFLRTAAALTCGG